MMHRKFKITQLVLLVLAIGSISAVMADDWGFFAHRRINRLAVFTLPEQMLPLFKKNIDFLSEHAVDPDKRRYAVRLEASRHYLDMDLYEGKCLPEDFNEAFSSYGLLGCVRGKDTTYLHIIDSSWCKDTKEALMTDGQMTWSIPKYAVRRLYRSFVVPSYYNLDHIIPVDSIKTLLGSRYQSVDQVFLKDDFSEHGLVPYVIEQYYGRLVNAFKQKDFNKILNIAADLGHYVGDAHVPLHACSNYNGQHTDQHGIHAFWESRIPELFADEQFDYFAGKALYLPSIREFAWTTIRNSGSLADSVLIIEKRLRQKFPHDQIMCFDQRLGQMVWIQCRDYADAYDKAMDGMVESRMRDAIRGVGSVWFSAWVDAGQPDLRSGVDLNIQWEVDSNVVKYEQIIQSGSKGYGRDHE